MTDFSTILSQSTRLTDGRTEFSSLDRVCIPCSAVKTGKTVCLLRWIHCARFYDSCQKWFINTERDWKHYMHSREQHDVTEAVYGLRRADDKTSREWVIRPSTSNDYWSPEFWWLVPVTISDGNNANGIRSNRFAPATCTNAFRITVSSLGFYVAYSW